MDMSGTRIVVVGSMEDNSKVSISDCSFKAVVDGREVSGLGTLEGDTSFVKVYNSLIDLCINADKCTALGSLAGSTKLDISTASVRVNNAGEKAVAFGGLEGETEISLVGVDTRVKIFNTLGVETFAKDENITIVNGRCRIVVNNEEIERELVFKFGE